MYKTEGMQIITNRSEYRTKQPLLVSEHLHTLTYCMV